MTLRDLAVRLRMFLAELLAVVIVTLGSLWRHRWLYAAAGAFAALWLLACMLTGFEPGAGPVHVLFYDGREAFEVVHVSYIHVFFGYLVMGLTWYCVGTMGHQDRLDRGMLFWHNMPIADGVWMAGQQLGVLAFFALGALAGLAYEMLFSLAEHAAFGRGRGLGEILAANFGDWLRMVKAGVLLWAILLPVGALLALCSLLWRPLLWWFVMAVPAGLAALRPAAAEASMEDWLLWYFDEAGRAAGALYLGRPLAESGVDLNLLLAAAALAGWLLLWLAAYRRRGVYKHMRRA